MSTTVALLDLLRRARTTKRAIDEVPIAVLPRTPDEAYAISRELTRDDGVVAGWKVGATSERGQQLLGLTSPFFGRIFAGTVLQSGGVWSPAIGVYAIEPEIAFILGNDLPPRHRAYDQQEVEAAVFAVAPALEINQPSFARPFEAGGLALIADNGVNVGACLGKGRRDWRALDLTGVTTEVEIDGEPRLNGTSSAVLGNPLRALTWLANELAHRGEQLSMGQVVLSGAMSAPRELRAGQSIRARFSGLEDVELALGGSEVMPRA